MTTIAYRKGILAADTQLTAGNSNIGGVEKIWKHGGFLYAAAGSWARCCALKMYCETGDASCLPRTNGLSEDRGENICAFRVDPEGNIAIYEALESKPSGYIVVFWVRLDAPFHAIGSGDEYALGAMAAGASAERAVRIACRYDTFSGGKVRSIRL